MYIRKIIINNITSLKGEHVIDFTREPLRSADLFAITGDTGAGKSTILDCICLALYNRAPRFALKEMLLPWQPTKRLRTDCPDMTRGMFCAVGRLKAHVPWNS